MAARKTCYKSRDKDGREIRYESPGSLMAQACKYFDWCDNNPWYKAELIRSGARVGEIVELPVARPYTVEGLCVFCGISMKTFRQYESDTAFGEVAAHLKTVISQQQLEGEIVGVYNTSILLKMQNIVKEEDTGEPGGLTINVLSQETKEQLLKLKESLSK